MTDNTFVRLEGLNWSRDRSWCRRRFQYCVWNSNFCLSLQRLLHVYPFHWCAECNRWAAERLWTPSETPSGWTFQFRGVPMPDQQKKRRVRSCKAQRTEEENTNDFFASYKSNAENIKEECNFYPFSSNLASAFQELHSFIDAFGKLGVFLGSTAINCSGSFCPNLSAPLKMPCVKKSFFLSMIDGTMK